jgi:hypothetical protein
MFFIMGVNTYHSHRSAKLAEGQGLFVIKKYRLKGEGKNDKNLLYT